MTKVYRQEEKEAFVVQWRESGKSQKQFSLEQGINHHTLKSWASKCREKIRVCRANVTVKSRPPSFTTKKMGVQNEEQVKNNIYSLAFFPLVSFS